MQDKRERILQSTAKIKSGEPGYPAALPTPETGRGLAQSRGRGSRSSLLSQKFSGCFLSSPYTIEPDSNSPVNGTVSDDNIPTSYSFYATSPCFKGLHTCGDTIEETIHNVENTIITYLSSLFIHSDIIPEDLHCIPYSIDSQGKIVFHFEDEMIFPASCPASCDTINDSLHGRSL